MNRYCLRHGFKSRKSSVAACGGSAQGHSGVEGGGGGERRCSGLGFHLLSRRLDPSLPNCHNF
jgi:hypothetical protein